MNIFEVISLEITEGKIQDFEVIKVMNIKIMRQ